MPAAHRVKLVVGGAALAGMITLGVAAYVGRHTSHGNPLELLVFSGVIAATWIFPLLILHQEETETLVLDEVFLIIMWLLFPPIDVILALGLGVVVGSVVRRRGALKAVFNSGQTISVAGLALAAMVAIDPGAQTAITARTVLAAAVGGTVYSLGTTMSVGFVIAVAERRSFLQTVVEAWRIRLLVLAGNVSVGLLAGLLGRAYPWALPIAIVPLGVLQLAFAGHLRAWRDRQRMHGLFETALRVHGPVALEEVEQAVAEGARDLLRTETARFDFRSPAAGEVGTRLDAYGDARWLIVSGRRGVEPFDDSDRSMLDAIVAIAGAALEKAALYREAHEERQKLADVVGSSSDGIISVNGEGRITSWNPAMEKITGYRAEEMIGTRHLGALRPRDAEGSDVLTEGWVESPDAPPSELQILSASGEVRWLSCAFSPMPDGGYVVVARDVTAQKEIEDLKADFLATVSHELRTPLTPIQGFLQTLLRQDAVFPTDQRQRFYQIMLAQSERLGRLVEQLLDAVSLQSRGEIITEAIDWGPLAANVVELIGQQTPERDVVLEVEKGLPSILADGHRAEQILSNLLVNAIKYSEPSETIRVTIRSLGSEVATTVADRGPGIPPADRERIFDRFTRLGEHLTRTTGGVGLGLYICKRLADAMGGRIWVEDVPEGGAAFTFTLPAWRLSAHPELLVERKAEARSF